MARSRWIAAIAFALTLAAECRSQGWERVETPLDPLIGWYEIEEGHPARLTWAPDGGLRLIDLDRLRVDDLRPGENGSWLWGRSADDVRVVDFDVGVDGVASAMRWRSGDGRIRSAERLERFGYEQLQVRFASGDGVELRGTVMLPYAGRPVPGAVLIHGSGASSRQNDWAMTIADALAMRGVAVLFPDKRGSGESGGDWRTADFEALAGDAVAAFETLGGVGGIDPEAVGYVGLSQGGWVAPLAARKTSPAFIADVSGSLTTPDVQLRHEISQDLRGAGLTRGQRSAVMGLFDASQRYARGEGSWEGYIDQRSRLLGDASLREAVEPFPDAPDHWRFSFWRPIGPFDPLPYWLAVEAPTLFVFGKQDRFDNMPLDATLERVNRVQRSRDGVTLVLYGDLGHALIDTEHGWVSTEFLATLGDWVLRSTGRAVSRPS